MFQKDFKSLAHGNDKQRDFSFVKETIYMYIINEDVVGTSKALTFHYTVI